MHPNPAFRSDDRALLESLVSEIGFGMIFAGLPDGPRVAHTPLLSTGDGAVQFHLSRANALARHLDGMVALAVINGPDAYVSPRWTENADQVPTWNYIALELEGRVRRMDGDGLSGLLDALTARQEARVEGGAPWTLDRIDRAALRKNMAAIIGFEMEILAWRPSLKLSQNKSAEDRARIADGLAAQGSLALAELMRNLGT